MNSAEQLQKQEAKIVELTNKNQQLRKENKSLNNKLKQYEFTIDIKTSSRYSKLNPLKVRG